MKELLTPVLIGLSFGNLWICALLVFTLQTTKKSTGIGYLIGRSLTIIALSIIIAIIGKMIKINFYILQIASGSFIIIYAIYISLMHVFNFIPPWKKKRNNKWNDPDNCEHDCQKCPTNYSSVCTSCDNKSLCFAEEPEVKKLVEQNGNKKNLAKKSGFIFGLSLGGVRGALLCGKLVVLAPIILSSTIYYALLGSSLFCISSSIYPIMGFVLGSFVLKLVKFKKYIFLISCVVLVLIGAWYIYLGFDIFMNQF